MSREPLSLETIPGAEQNASAAEFSEPRKESGPWGASDGETPAPRPAAGRRSFAALRGGAGPISRAAPVHCFALRPDARPMHNDGRPGELARIQEQRLQFRFRRCAPPALGACLAVGARDALGHLGFLSVVVDRHLPSEVDHSVVEGYVGGVLEPLLEAEQFAPAFHKERLQFMVEYDETTLIELTQIGVFKRTLLDRVQVCPKCRGLPSVRQGCPSCGSARFDHDTMVHHFACAWIAPVANFESNQEMICPKCRTRPLVIGVDYEYLPGVLRCRDCGNQDFEPLSVGQCLGCRHRFRCEDARVLDIFGYQAQRLDLGRLLHGRAR